MALLHYGEMALAATGMERRIVCVAGLYLCAAEYERRFVVAALAGPIGGGFRRALGCGVTSVSFRAAG
jgi:hypothetical protein